MGLKTNLDTWQFYDVEYLRDHKITESNVLDYKEDLDADQDLLKMLCGFANGNGGYLIYGVEETDEEPTYPKSFLGLDPSRFDLQRLEQVINTGISPRLRFQKRVLDIPSSAGKILLFYVPEGNDQPYYCIKTNRFYLRYDLETRPMTEAEISSRYKERFVAEDKVEEYIVKAIEHHRNISQRTVVVPGDSGVTRNVIDAHIFIFPPNINRRRLEITGGNTLNYDHNNIRYEPKPRDIYLPQGLRKPNKFGLEWSDYDLACRVEIHRNGLVHHVDDYGRQYDDIPGGHTKLSPLYIHDIRLAEDLLMTLQFAGRVFSDIEYIGPVTMKLRILEANEIQLVRRNHWAPSEQFISRSDLIEIEREWNSWEIANDYVAIGKSIMDEFCNHFGLWEYFEFKPNGYFHRLLPAQT